MRKCILFLCIGIILSAPTASLNAECGLCGDLNGDGSINIVDLVAFSNMCNQFPPIEPACPQGADMDCNGAVFCSEMTILINYMFYGGPAPCDTDEWPACS